MGANALLPDVEVAALVMFLLADVGWICWMPILALCTLFLAFVLQAYIVNTVRRKNCITLPYQCGLLLWVVGNALWMWSEFVWEKSSPAGVLAHSETITHLDKEHQRMFFLVAAVVLLVSFIVVTAWARWVYINEGLGYTPLFLYAEMYVPPWLLMDASWIFMDLKRLDKTGTGDFFFVVCMITGLATISLCAHCTYLFAAKRNWGEAAICSSSLAWIAGNVVWIINDKVHDDENRALHIFALLFFLVGVVAAFCRCYRGTGESRELLSGGNNKTLNL
eukprot:gnl/TRDRNA2_/TRDRNA2_189474_c0_seq1.p1 gnl/TRDRNA2_/TRDRNA2_189474_c0~~gnl/TRDRNA2_/TRDRNA2_189474_c0_seq1.p1  ORF type:complete len:278 (-),score=51.24 gnl/TRDRNA2_/TRDRNA2_189474_c0_seq1:41-874(-)